jgi:RNA polymerase sigma-70 factor, ECF subfamily
MQADAQNTNQAMARYADGDEESFAVVYRALGPMVRRCHARWSGEGSADDLTQQTFMALHRGRHRYRPGTAIQPLLMVIARRTSIDALRKRARSRESLTRGGDLPPTLVSDGSDARHTAAAVHDALAELPDGQRAVIERHKLLGFSFTEVAADLGIGEQAARVRASRAYRQLRTLLDDYALAA